MKRSLTSALALAVLSLAPAPRLEAAPGLLGGFQPRVPVSAFARPMAWLDPARLDISATLSFGAGGHGPAEGLQVTTLRYRFGAPWTLQLGLGSTLSGGSRVGNGLFLESLDLDYQPSGSTWLRVRYQDFRSPLQRQRLFWGE